MTQDTSVDREARIRRALKHLANDTTDQFEEIEFFEAHEFTDPEIAQRERDLIFGKVPTIVAHGSELAKTYDFKTVQLPRNRVILTRQKDGSDRKSTRLNSSH